MGLIIALFLYQLFEKACIILCLASFFLITGNFKRQSLTSSTLGAEFLMCFIEGVMPGYFYRSWSKSNIC